MSVYTIQAPCNSLGEPALESAVFLREGFSWGAFLFGFLWLLWEGLWLTAILWIAIGAALAFLTLSYLGLGAAILIAFAVQLLLGLEAHVLLRHKLARRDYRLVGAIAAETYEAAERRFFHGAARSQERPGARRDPAPPSLPSVVPIGDSGVLGSLPLPEEHK